MDKKNLEKDLQDAASAPVSEQENDPEENAADSQGEQEVHKSNATDDKKGKRKKRKGKKSNPKTITVDGNHVPLKGFVKEYKELVDGMPKLSKFQRKAIRRYHRE
ncbi:hypothetical protein VU10_07910, partial [Desulfobulbus sp. US1]|nr:hypothetical protein [Desulfobulbus sp. US1]